MTAIYNKIPKGSRENFLEELLNAYVDKQGLGAMPKGDFDALIVHLYRKYCDGDRFDAFELSQLFMIREPRLKTLVQMGELKFGTMVEGDAWCAVLTNTATARFSVESLERGEMRFKLENPSLFPYLQKRIRNLGATAKFSPSAEEVRMELTVFFEVLDQIHMASQTDFSTEKHLEHVQRDIRRTIEQVGKSLGKKRLKQLKGETSALGEALDRASKMAGIGSLVAALA